MFPNQGGCRSRMLQQLFALLFLCFLGQGRGSCPCLEVIAELDAEKDQDNSILYTSLGTGTTYTWPENYGHGFCSAHDKDLAPFCHGSFAPRWCELPWCYVDQSTCNELTLKSSFFPQHENLYFSYAACGSNWTFEHPIVSEDSALKLLSTAEGYLISTRDAIEDEYLTTDLEPIEPCPLGSRFCEDCPQCEELPAWGSTKVDYSDVGFWLNEQGTYLEDNAATCTASGVRSMYAKVASTEGSPDRIGYQYFADQASGSYTQMPHTEWCPEETSNSDYDPRRRPWFASGATGPKDVMIVVDVSGSMGTTIGGTTRWEVAYEATKAILDTLSWADYANIVLFSSYASSYSTRLVPMTDSNREAMKSWADQQNWKSGGTDFKNGMDLALQIIRDSVSDGHTSTCNKAILFLTDGEPNPNSWTADNVEELRTATQDLGISVLTYGLGSDASAEHIRPMACQNSGIYFQLSDGEAEFYLSDAMTSYYEFFAGGQQKCQASYVKYADAVTSTPLYAGCLPVFDRNGSEPSLLGVSCMDLNLLVELDTEDQSGAAWEDLICRMSAQTKVCLPLNLGECDLQRLRATTAYAQKCDDSDPAPDQCGCVDPTCVDNQTWTDEQKYFCDAWVGDICEEAMEDFGYSAQGMADVLEHCPHSCGTCPLLPAGDARCSQRYCQEDNTLAGSCRACDGIVPGLDLEGMSIACPGARASTAWTTTTDQAGEGDNNDGTTQVSGGAGDDGTTHVSGGDTQIGGGDDDGVTTGSDIGIIIAAVIGSIVAVAIIGAAITIGVRFKLFGGCFSTPPAAMTYAVAHGTIRAPAAGAGTPTAVAAPAPLVPFPKIWMNRDPTKIFTAVLPAQNLIPAAQHLLDSTYAKVTTRDRGGVVPDKLQVVQVQRIENSALWQKYNAGKAKISTKRPHRCTKLANISGGQVKPMTRAGEELTAAGAGDNMDARINEVYLFHGTSPDGATGIAKDGFNLRLAGSAVGSMYGRGVYLAEMCSKSDEYAKDSASVMYKGLYCLLLCRVVLGEVLTMTAGGDSVHPVVKAAMESGSYDSVMGDRAASVGTYREFIVYAEEQVYPEFLIMYSRVHNEETV